MDPTSIALILSLISEGVGVASKIADLARRVKAGEKITDEEITATRDSVNEAVDNWNNT